MLSLRVMTLSAPAEVATLMIEGSTAPSTGQAKSTVGFTWRMVSNVDCATSVAGRRCLSEPDTSRPLWVQRRQVRVAVGQGDDLVPLDCLVEGVQPLVGDGLVLPWTVVSPLRTR